MTRTTSDSQNSDSQDSDSQNSDSQNSDSQDSDSRDEASGQEDSAGKQADRKTSGTEDRADGDSEDQDSGGRHSVSDTGRHHRTEAAAFSWFVEPPPAVHLRAHDPRELFSIQPAEPQAAHALPDHVARLMLGTPAHARPAHAAA